MLVCAILHNFIGHYHGYDIYFNMSQIEMQFDVELGAVLALDDELNMYVTIGERFQRDKLRYSIANELWKAQAYLDDKNDFLANLVEEQGFDLKDDNLEGKYKEWQKKLHPDLVHSKSEKEKTYAVEQSARVIDAYRTLSKPLSRALYLVLQLAGIFVDEEKTVMDPELLSEMMDVREAVEEASDPKVLMEIQHQIERKHEDWSNSFREAFNKQDFDSAISATQKMRYYERAIEEIVKKL
ncbi:hypothetical protein M5K25_026101 [Dendrobium thyrsiflorum]|uniref:Co-chaperone HscB C-terminal oligomerisation domain-containing protein n=1 Tax=Dendrobium thyrsiflorum TaxID=117978 RepID=A0ABD0TWN3_DENTH